jgi:hypothetical protein
MLLGNAAALAGAATITYLRELVMRNRPRADPSRPVAPPTAPDADRLNLQGRIKNEYAEMPGLCVTRIQAQKLWGLDAPACDEALSALVSEGYLRQALMGYVKA